MSGNAPQPRTALHAALEAQQKTIAALAHKVAVQDVLIDYVADLAGVTPQVTAIRKKADADNPAQPVPNPPSEQAFETTEQAVTPETHDNVQNPGMTPGSVQDIAADTTDVALAPGESLPTAPFNDLVNVQAPVAGTETQLPLDQTRIETDVRVDQQKASPVSNPDVAFPWTLASKDGDQSGRTVASIRLARLQIEAGLVDETDDLVLGAKIERSAVSNQDIATNIATLEQVKTASAQRAQRPQHLVPRAASAGARTTPSLVSDGAGLTATAGVGVVDNDTADSDLFD